MYQSGSGDYTIDYVYVPRETTDFRNVHVDFKYLEDFSILTLTSSESIDPGDLESIIKVLQSDYFKKMKIDLTTDCEIYLNIDSNLQSDLYRVVMADETLAIKELILEN